MEIGSSTFDTFWTLQSPNHTLKLCGIASSRGVRIKNAAQSSKQVSIRDFMNLGSRDKIGKINENYENHWFSTAKFKHFDDFMSHKLLIFVYFLSYLYTCATGMNFCDNHRIINIYNRMFWFFDEIHFFRDFEWILWFSTHFSLKNHWFSLIFIDFHQFWCFCASL